MNIELGSPIGGLVVHDQMNRISCTYGDDDDGRIILSVALREQFGCLREGGWGGGGVLAGFFFIRTSLSLLAKRTIEFSLSWIFSGQKGCVIFFLKNLPPPLPHKNRMGATICTKYNGK